MSKYIALVGEAFGEREEKLGHPFVGPSGKLLDGFLSANGLSRRDCLITNVFNFRPVRNDIKTLTTSKDYAIKGVPKHGKGWIHRKYQCELDRLFSELNAGKPNVVVALGATATWALLHDNRITKLRGYQYTSVRGQFKVIPTFHPANVLRDYKQRPVVFSDFAKIAREAAFPEIRRPARELWLNPTIPDLHEFEKYIYAASYLTVDVETEARQITCIGFSPSPDRAIVIPFVDKSKPNKSYWPTRQNELIAWSYVRKWLRSDIPKVNQNIAYDLRYLWEIYGIPIHNIVGDTMLRHHAMQPEMAGSEQDDGRVTSRKKGQGGRKSLAFLGSIYSHEPSWKSLRSEVATAKKETDT